MTLIKNDHVKWMKVAFREAEKAFEQDEVPIGAVVVQNGQIIGRGYNQCESLTDPTAHAEIIAITSASNTIKDWRLKDCQLYVTKEPCPMCAGALINARINMVIFGMYDEKEGCCGSLYQLCRDNRFKHQLTVKGGIMEDACTLMIQEFFKKQREKD
ncbi:MAG: tRNA adenosine(34) deaminase TadA [Candidatus Marinimicrobia bacterium]|nr:tRNA adenosine(34) deaminase TadA [Candidatus Neomarinimicrobiota bacterium]